MNLLNDLKPPIHILACATVDSLLIVLFLFLSLQAWHILLPNILYISNRLSSQAHSMRCLHQLLSSHHGHGFDRRWTSPITYSNSGKYPMIYDATSSCDVPCKQPCDLPLLL
ncbi:hypothetical protein VPH35_084761 [Triticum aestivum]